MQFTALSVRRGWAYPNPKLIEDYLLALLRANRYVYKNRSGTLAIIRDFFKFNPITRNGFMIIRCAIK